MTEHRSFGILFVCFANQCRSPMAERLAGKAFTDRFGVDGARVEMSSAGTDAYDGVAMHPGSMRVLDELGVPGDGFASRVLTPRLIADADLVLTATRQQRSVCVTLEPAALRYAFTLRQFSRMAAALGPVPPAAREQPPDGRMRALVEQVVAGRSRLQPAAPADDDLADPVGRPAAAFRACAVEIRRTLDAVLEVIDPS